jgi:hypothetical protein
VLLKTTEPGLNFVHTSGLFGDPPTQVDPTSNLQSEEHPSLLLLLPSSH